MGNYKEGQIAVVLRADIPFQVKENIADAKHYYGENIDNLEKRLKTLKQRPEKFFREGDLFSLGIEFEFIAFCPWENKDCSWSPEEFNCLVYAKEHGLPFNTSKDFEKIYLSDEKFFESVYITRMKQLLKSSLYKQLKIRMSVMSKQYTTEFDDFLDYIRPYVIDDYKKHLYHKIGHVEDEDGWVNKDFYMYPDKITVKEEDYKSVCEGCDEYIEGRHCKLYMVCKRAYERGQKSIKDKKKKGGKNVDNAKKGV